MNPCHIDINWTNNQSPAINDTNLGQINTELREIDTRVCSLANDPAGEALVSEGWAEGTQDGVPVASGSPYYQNNSDYHRLESEGWANGEQNGVPVSSGSPYYENNAKYWKEQAAAIAGQTLGSLTDVNITTPADGQALVYDSNSSEWVNGNVSSQTTNPNLLMNPWFTVNQRGSASYSAAAYTLDRWKASNGGLTVSQTSNGVTLANGIAYRVTLYQMFESSYLRGKTLTLSVMMANGTIYSGTITAPSSAGVADMTFGTNSALRYQVTNNNDDQFVIVVGENETLNIRAVKMELGAKSTIALDAPPDYTTELLKCQRYFVRLTASAANNSWMTVQQLSNEWALALYSVSADMRTTPTLSSSGTFVKNVEGVATNITSISVTGKTGNNIQISIKVNGQAGVLGTLRSTGASDYLDFDAEL